MKTKIRLQIIGQITFVTKKLTFRAQALRHDVFFLIKKLSNLFSLVYTVLDATMVV